jgi:hypothetical protein
MTQRPTTPTTIGAALYGPAGSATEVRDVAQTAAQSATLATWFCVIPGAHPFWSRYVLSVIHLRPIPGTPPARLVFPEATHEVLVVALNPEHHPRADDLATWQHLTPINVSQQFSGVTDDQARRLAQQLALDVVDGALLVEPQGIRGAAEQWRQVIAREVARLQGADE